MEAIVSKFCDKQCEALSALLQCIMIICRSHILSSTTSKNSSWSFDAFNAISSVELGLDMCDANMFTIRVVGKELQSVAIFGGRQRRTFLYLLLERKHSQVYNNYCRYMQIGHYNIIVDKFINWLMNLWHWTNIHKANFLFYHKHQHHIL